VTDEHVVQPSVPGAQPVPADERVRTHIATLDGIEQRPLSEHAQAYSDVHAELQAALTEIDDASG